MSIIRDKIKVVVLVGNDGTTAKKIKYDEKIIYKGYSYDVWKQLKLKLKDKYIFEETFRKFRWLFISCGYD